MSSETAVRLVREVRSVYMQQILQERQAASPDAERMETLKAKLAQCAADEQALTTATDEEVAEIGARYAALNQELGRE